MLPALLLFEAVILNFLPFPRGHIQNEVIGGRGEYRLILDTAPTSCNLGVGVLGSLL